MHVLLIEPNTKRAQHLKKILRRFRYETDHVARAEGALTRLELRARDYDLILFNALTGDMDPELWCKTVREQEITIPIIALTQSNDDLLIVRMLIQYVDDFVRLPVKAMELLARIQAVIRRPRNISVPITTVGSLTVDGRSGAVWHKNERVNLSRKEFSILEYLARKQGNVVSREDIIGHTWEIPGATAHNTLDAHIKNIRRKISHITDCSLETVRGQGYSLRCD